MSRLLQGFLIVMLSAVAALSVRAADPPQDSAKKVSSSKEPGQAKGQPKQAAAPAGGMTVFIDPATGQIRQPDPSEIGALVTPVNPPPKAPESVPMQGPGGAVGVRLGPESMSYTVLTIAPDGKDTVDCVTGEKAANALATTPPAQTREALNRPQEPHTRTDSKQNSKTPQDSRNVKNPR